MNASMPKHSSFSLTRSSAESLQESPQDRHASLLAKRSTAIHCLVGAIIMVWYYFVVSGIKAKLEKTAAEVSRAATFVILQSDAIVNYWYLLLIIGSIVMVVDFRVTRWIGKKLGLNRALYFGVCITMTLLVSVACAVQRRIRAVTTLHLLRSVSNRKRCLTGFAATPQRKPRQNR